MILVDTSVWIDLLRGIDSPQARLLDKLISGEHDISITEIILTEILQGIKQDRDFQVMRKYLIEFPIYRPKDFKTYVKAAQIYRDCRRRGKAIRKTVDCIIAAICIENSLTLLHKDNDFDLIQVCTSLRCLRCDL